MGLTKRVSFLESEKAVTIWHNHILEFPTVLESNFHVRL